MKTNTNPAGTSGTISRMWRTGCIVATLVAGGACSSTPATDVGPPPYPHASDSIGALRQIYDGVLTPDMAVNTFRNIDRLLPTRVIEASTTPRPLPVDAAPFTTVQFDAGGQSWSLNDYIKKNRVAGILILQHGRVKLERFQFGNTERTRWMSMSIAKSITSTLIGAALKDGFIKSLDDSVTQYVPVLVGSGYDGVTIRDILTMSSGVQWTETYTNPRSDRRRLLNAQLSLTPGSAMNIMKALPRFAPPGTANNYSTGETQVAAEILRGAVKRPLAEYLSEKVWRPFGMEADALWWLESPHGTEIGGSGISATLRDYGRFGLFMLANGVTAGDTVLPPGWVREATSATTLRGGKPLDYGYLWWTAESAGDRRDHAYVAEGIHGQFIYVNPARDLVIVVWQAQSKPVGGGVIDDRTFFRAVADALP